MNKFYEIVEYEEVKIYKEQVYNASSLQKCRELHKKLVSEGTIEGDFDSDKWMGYSGVKKYGIDFSLDSIGYNQHIGKEFGITIDTMKNMLRCFVIVCHGKYVHETIAQTKIGAVKEFLLKYKDKGFKLNKEEKAAIIQFLGFISTPENQIEQIILRIGSKEGTDVRQRKLAPIINYLVIEDAIDQIYRDGCDDIVFKKWFPIYFWIKITFILPLRATEMLLTPKDCIYRENGKIFLKVRRTNLKGSGEKNVYYNVDKDYTIFTYNIPNIEAIYYIEKYLKLTSSQDRRFLFEYNEWMVNDMLSRAAFNHLLEEFIKETIIGNTKYDFVKYASGITEFEVVTAGDSRPIAMANLYFQKSGADICRQLAGHVNIDTSAGYYTNISDTIWASSIIELQKKLDYERRYTQEVYEGSKNTCVDVSKAMCTSRKRLIDEENIDDCIEQDHLEDCMGCKFYRPTSKELETFLEFQQKKADDSSKKVIESMNKIMKIKKQNMTLEELFLAAQTDGTRYRMGCDIKAEGKLKEWQRHKNIQKTSC